MCFVIAEVVSGVIGESVVLQCDASDLLHLGNRLGQIAMSSWNVMIDASVVKTALIGKCRRD